ncbi:hypothetical protein BpHYR1_016192 [Brachionus plicatilis]|uniref:Uncharacterized protein n=1 Tax=Brachionus plicatilis TaxID=10195 RepID=A0A3M7R3I5_BRAPC|nr:hypothetical protein BpHYR1_016192 [Brachionus plicatilis]
MFTLIKIHILFIDILIVPLIKGKSFGRIKKILCNYCSIKIQLNLNYRIKIYLIEYFHIFKNKK